MTSQQKVLKLPKFDYNIQITTLSLLKHPNLKPSGVTQEFEPQLKQLVNNVLQPPTLKQMSF